MDLVSLSRSMCVRIKPISFIIIAWPNSFYLVVAGMVYIVDRGDKAEKVGVEIGDVVVGVSFIFGDDYLVNVTGQGVDRVQSLIRSRGPAYVCLRLRKGKREADVCFRSLVHI